MKRNLVWLLVCSIQLTGIGVASAQSAEPEAAADTEAAPSGAVGQAREHFQKGVSYYAEGDLVAARVELERAYSLEPSYRLLFNLGQVSYEQRDYVAAERYFRDYLEQGGDEVEPERRAEVERDLAKLSERVANVAVRTNVADAVVFVDGREVARTPLAKRLRMSAGRRHIRLESAGHAPITREVDVIGGERLAIELTFGPKLDPVTGSGTASASGTHPALWTGIVTGVLALGAGGMAYWAGVDDRAYDRELERPTTRSELDAIADRTKTKALIADVLLGTALVSAAVTVGLLIAIDTPQERASNERDDSGVKVGLGSVSGRF